MKQFVVALRVLPVGDRRSHGAFGICRADIVAHANENIGWRYALRELNPFVIPDISYDQHNKDGSLDLFDPKTGTGTMTEAWLEERAANDGSWALAA